VDMEGNEASERKDKLFFHVSQGRGREEVGGEHKEEQGLHSGEPGAIRGLLGGAY